MFPIDFPALIESCCVSSPAPISDNFLLVSDAYQKKIFQMDLSTKKIQAVDVDTENMAISIDYDPTSKMVGTLEATIM